MRGEHIPRRHWHFCAQLYARYGIAPSQADLMDCIRGAALGQATVVREHPSEGTKVVLLYWDSPPMEIQAVFRRADGPEHQDPGLFITALQPGSYIRVGGSWAQAHPERGHGYAASRPRRRV